MSDKPSPFDNLPPEVSTLVFSYLSGQDLGRARVSTRFRDEIREMKRLQLQQLADDIRRTRLELLQDIFKETKRDKANALANLLKDAIPKIQDIHRVCASWNVMRLPLADIALCLQSSVDLLTFSVKDSTGDPGWLPLVSNATALVAILSPEVAGRQIRNASELP